MLNGYKSRSTIAIAALVCAAAIGCDSSVGPDGGATSQSPPTLPTVPSAPTTTSPSAKPDDAKVDYARLLLEPGDLSDADDTFAARSTTPTGPDGHPGASALFVNQDDTRAISDTIVIYPDAAAASSTLRDALPTLGSTITGATSRPAPVGTDGTMAVGMSTDGTKAVTLLLFTQGPA